MSTHVEQGDRALQPRTALVPEGSDSLLHVVRSEWTKFWSVRSTLWSLLGLVVVTVGVGILSTWGTMFNLYDQGGRPQPFDPTNITLGGLGLGQLAGAVLGVMVISSEYGTGAIRSTLTATPRRVQLLVAKSLVFVVVALAVGLLTCFLAFFTAMPFLHEQYRVDLGDPGVLRAVVGGGLYVAGSGMFGFALGALLRHTAGAISAAVALLLVLPPLSLLLPGDWGDTVTRHFTSNAGQTITFAQQVPGAAPISILGPWEGYAWFTAEWLLLLAVAGFLMRRRDA